MNYLLTPGPAVIETVFKYSTCMLLLITDIVFVLERFSSETPWLYLEKAICLSSI